MPSKVFHRSFAGGEVSPEMSSRIDDARYQTGVARARNFVTRPHGPAQKRPGWAFCNATRTHSTKSRMIPFRFSGTQQLAIECGFRSEYPGTSTVPGYFRFHSRGAPVRVATAWSSTTAYAVGDQVMQGGILYRCLLAHTNQSPPNVTYWKSLEYVSNKTFLPAAVNLATDEITFGAAHGLVANDPVEFTNDSAGAAIQYELPLGVFNNLSTCYVLVVSPTVIKVSLTPGGAALDLVGAGSGGPHRMHFSYTGGDLVSYSGAVWHCRTTRPISAPPALSIVPGASETYWYQQPSTLEYEIPHGMAISEAELFELTFSQSLDIMTLCTRSVFQSELRRYGTTRWTWSQFSFAPSIAAPGTPTVTPTYGATIAIEEVMSLVAYIRVLLPAGKPSHGLAQGDAVEIRGLTSKGIAENTFLIADSNGPGGEADEFSMEHVTTGQPVIAGATGLIAGTCRVTSLGSDATNSYVVTAIADDDRESQPSPVGSASNNLNVDGASNLISWPAVAGAVRYRVYKLLPQSSLYGRIGESDGTTFQDDNIGPDIGITPPKLDTSLGSAADTAPRAVCNYQGRRCFAGSGANPQDFWATRSNTESDLSYHLPVQANDRIRRQIGSREACTIRHLVPTGRLIALTDSTEFTLSPVSSDVLSPDSFVAIPHSFVGASPAQPVVADGLVLFVGRRDAHLYGFGYDDAANGFKPVDLSLRAAHLFDGYTIADLALARSPLQIAWATSSGAMLGLTLVPDQAVVGWHWHDTDGVVESCCTIQEDGEDRLYAVIQRTIGGATKRYVERMGSLRTQTLANSFYVDSGITVTSSLAVTVVTGLSHLEDKTVQVLANGRVQATRKVVGGQITLATPLAAGSNVVHVGLGYTAELQTLPAVLEIEAFAQGRPRNISRCFLRVLNSGGFRVGPTADDLVPDGVTAAGALLTGEVDVTIPSSWASGQVLIRSTDPLPLTVASMTLNLEVGG